VTGAVGARAASSETQRLIGFAAIAAGLLALDLASKWAARGLGHLPAVDSARNERLMLGAPGLSGTVLLLAVTAAATAATIFAFRLWRAGRVAIWVPAAMAAGTVGNFVDRLLLGGVRDWLVVGPIRFNLADVLLAIAIPMVVIAGIRAESDQQ